MNARPRAVLLLLGALALASGIAGGLARLGLSVPVPVASSAAFHGVLMVSGFLGTVIALERAVALGMQWAYAAPLASGVGTVLLLAGVPAAGLALWIVAPVLLIAASVAIARRQLALHTVLLAVAALAWLAAGVAFASGRTDAAPAWGFAFLVLTIAAERLEMTRLARRPAVAAPIFVGIVALLVVGAAASLGEGGAGPLLYGLALCGLAVWLAAFDVARRTIRAEGFARYAAVALLAGYAWLAAAGAAWAFGLGRDLALHALGLGFVFSMILAHAPLVVPVVLRRRLRFTALFYLPLALLHASLLLRLGPGMADAGIRSAGGVLNALALAAFVATLLGSLARGARIPGPDPRG